MKKLIAVTLFFSIVFPVTIWSQCKFEKNETDDFTGNYIKESKPVSVLKKLSPPNYIDFIFIQEGDDFFIKISWHGPINEETIVSEEDYLILKLLDEAVINVKPEKEYQGFLKKGIGLTYIKPMYRITRESIEKLADSALSQFRITKEGGEKHDFKVKSKVAEKLQNAAKCMIDQN